MAEKRFKTVKNDDFDRKITFGVGSMWPKAYEIHAKYNPTHVHNLQPIVARFVLRGIRRYSSLNGRHLARLVAITRERHLT